MADQALFDVLRAWDANGQPAPGATATFYASGTLTLISVYTDLTAATLGTNPVVADGDGVFPQRFITQAAKAVVADADGATLYTIDPVPMVKSDFGAAAAVSFSPSLLLPYSDVQSALDGGFEAVDGRINDLSAGKQDEDATLTSLSALSLAAGDVLYATAADTLARLPKGTAYQPLLMNAAATAPEYRAIGPVIGTAQTPTTTTPVDFTSLPAGINRFTLSFVDMQLSGTDNVVVQIGDAGGFETTGYASGSRIVDTVIQATETSGFVIVLGNATYAFTGLMDFVRVTGNTWAVSVNGFETGTNLSAMTGGGFKALSDVLTQVRVKPSGSDNFVSSTTVNVAFG